MVTIHPIAQRTESNDELSPHSRIIRLSTPVLWYISNNLLNVAKFAFSIYKKKSWFNKSNIMADKCLWSPSEENINTNHAYAFIQAVNQKFSISLESYHELYQWSVAHKEHFWSFWAEYSNFPFIQPYSSVLTHDEIMEKSQWFPGARTNYAKKVLSYTGSQSAIIAYKENGDRRELSRDQLMTWVRRSAASLKVLGLQQGDRLAAYMPNTVEALVMMLACASMGVIWSSCSPDFGIQGVVDRFGQIEPKILLTVDGYLYAGKKHKLLEKVKATTEAIPSLSQVIVVPFLDDDPDISCLKRLSPDIMQWQDFIRLDVDDTPLQFTPLLFNHPLYILYSSGTTGEPKCIVHGHGGSLIQHMKEHQLHVNIQEGDRVFYFTTCGWMMWNWLVSTLASGACAILYDGSPFHSGPEILWQLTEKERINVFGTSAKYLSSLLKASYHPLEHHHLGHLNTILSTGSPLSPDDFDFVYQHISPDLCLSSISGGTDIVSCFVLGSSLLPVYRGQIQCRGLGMDVQFFDDNGKAHTAKKGELVCCQSFPSMPIGFWNDEQGEKYHKAYFTRFENIWSHGDYGELTQEGGVILHGRSDTTLNPGGVRIGTAEIYRQVEKLDEIKESLVVGQKWQGDERIVLFVILSEGRMLTDSIREKIRQVIRLNTTPRHVPAKIIQINDFPRTRSGKISEPAVKAVIHDEYVKNTHALANADILESYKRLDELLE